MKVGLIVILLSLAVRLGCPATPCQYLQRYRLFALSLLGPLATPFQLGGYRGQRGHFRSSVRSSASPSVLLEMR